jgi:hypothetical protein
MPERFLLRIPQLLCCAYTLLLIPGCGSGNSTPDEVSACRARISAQPEGIHGCITHSDDVGNPPSPTGPYSGFPVEVFLSEPPGTPEDGLAPFAQTKSDAEGFYELGLSSGTYWLCTSFRRCAEVTIPPGTNVAFDYDFGLGPGWSFR